MCSQDHTVRQVRLRAEVEKRRSLVVPTVICNGLWIGRSKKITEMHTHTHTHTSQFSRSHDKNRISIRRHRLCNLTCMYTSGMHVPIPRQMACEVLRARTYFSRACLGEAMEHRRKCCLPRKKKPDTSGIRKPNATITLLMRLNDLRRVLDRSVPTYACPQHSSREEGSR